MKSSVYILIFALMPFLSAWTQEVRDVADADITNAIETSFWADDAVSANAIDTSTMNGIVSLSGSVDSILAKERARDIAAATVGVRAVINEIDVDPLLPRGDEDLAEAVENAWLRDPAVRTWELAVDASAGEVTLSGTVDSFAKRELAETVAKGVRGVIAVENNIDVEYALLRTDAEILAEIEARLQNNIRVDDALIEVAVENGNVHLSGEVGSLTERDQARVLAWVSGVNSVDVDDVDIRWWVRNEMRRVREDLSLDDETIQANVLAALAYDPRVYSFEVDVRVTAGTVYLSGEVDNFAAKSAAEATTRNTMGVTSVHNHIRVRTDIPSDEALESQVAAALLGDPLVNRYDITVSAESGWVYLSGDVNTSAQKERVREVAERQTGVLGVVNQVEYAYTWNWRPDWQIRQNVINQLEWSPFVDETFVNVSVDQGVVTLTGTVYSWTEKNEARKNAFQGGAKNVNNQLVVDNMYYGPYSPHYFGSPHYVPGIGY